MANGKLKKKLGMTKRPTAVGQEKFGDVDVTGETSSSQSPPQDSTGIYLQRFMKEMEKLKKARLAREKAAKPTDRWHRPR